LPQRYVIHAGRQLSVKELLP